MRSVLYSIFFLVSLEGLHAQTRDSNLDYGLAFASHEVSKDHRTGLDLNPEGPYSINKDFTIEFDLALQRLNNAYGYILRVIANDSLNIDLMSTPEHDAFNDITLVINNKPTAIHFDFTDIALQPNKWTKFRLAFSLRDNHITLSWNDKSRSDSYDLAALTKFRFYFGVNDFQKFNTTDTPPIVLRNIAITESDILIRKWPLKNHNLTEVYDSIENAKAVIKNPTWLIDRHTRWTPRQHFTSGRFSSVAFNSDSALLYVTDEKHFYVYDLKQEKVSKRMVKGSPVHSDANQLLFIYEKNQLINYDLFTNKFLPFDITGKAWKNPDTTYHEPNYWHNNKFYSTVEDAVYTFGGYGHFTYHNQFFKYDNKKNNWEKVETKGSIPPRYLAASGIQHSTGQLLIFGGYGSMSGKQELSPQSFYDLYTFDLKSHEVKKIRDYDAPEKHEDIAFSNSLIVNDEENCFYVLSYPKNKYEGQIKLRQYSLNSNESKLLADSIPFPFHDEDSFCDLFYSKATRELIAVTAHKEKGGYELQVHSINYVPLQLLDARQTAPSERITTTAYAALGIFIVLTGILIYVYNRRKNQKPVPAISTQIRESTSQPSFIAELTQSDEQRKFVSSILFFGGFQVFDKNGADISSKFTMTLKELFALIVLHSVKFEKGVSATVIQEYLWPDKDEVSARNNRNVNVKKLRTLLEEVGGISIENNNSYLKLTMEENIFCDYQVVYKVLSRDNVISDEKEKINIIIANVKRGSLLPNLQTSWLDSFKSDISNLIIDTLIDYSQKLDSSKDDKLLLEIADAVFMYDSINQEALMIKCSVLNKKGKYSLAKTWYDHFAKEYQKLYAENYPRTFEDVIS
jgi:two-component SAPR family response regulator